MKRMIIVGVMLLAAGCAEVPVFHTYSLVNGKVVRCSGAVVSNCGVSLWDCETGERFACQQNVQTTK